MIILNSMVRSPLLTVIDKTGLRIQIFFTLEFYLPTAW
jgi:hypothetical protein